jgi:uncharacterized membrane-anchored protein
VPQVTAFFWIIKGLSTAMGEATSDYLVHRMAPVAAVGLGFLGFVVALVLQFSMRRYVAWTYWFAVMMVGVFGTWQHTEHTLSFHTIDSSRREAFYWAAVVATFAMGTAVGDLTATTLHIGYFGSVVLFAVLILVPAAGYRLLGWNAILTFWSAYVLTRPLGASFADWIGKPANLSGLWWGEGRLALVLTLAIVVLVAYLAVTKRDVQRRR